MVMAAVLSNGLKNVLQLRSLAGLSKLRVAAPVQSCIPALHIHRHHNNHHGNSTASSFSTAAQPTGPNEGLASVISQGIAPLESTASEVESQTRAKFVKSKRSDEPSINQMMENNRLQEVISECVEDMVMEETKAGGRKGTNIRPGQGLAYGGDPIVIVDVQVNSNLRLAKVYWSLPYGILMDEEVTRNVYVKLMEVMEERVKRDAKVIQRRVHTKLRSYFPPRLRMYRATDMMLKDIIDEFIDTDQQ